MPFLISAQVTGPLCANPGRGTGQGLRLAALAMAAAMALSACNESRDAPAPKAAGEAPAVPVALADSAASAPAYAPPPAETLYRMVAPIALYPDKLVAQILAGATYPDQVAAAELWLAQNPGLQAEALHDAATTQAWDPAVQSLLQFPNVLAQLAVNIPWTTALGKAYYNDPADVMNAIQVMRQRSYAAGTLKSSSQLKVEVASRPAAALPATPAREGLAEPLTSMLPVPVIDTPSQFIEIAPAQPDAVYVPQYDPAIAYGQPLPVYGGYRYVVAPPPAPVVLGGMGTPVAAALIGFGSAVVLNQVVTPRPWGWHAWGMRWGEPGHRWRHDGPPPPAARPAVIYNNNIYVSHSGTVGQDPRAANHWHPDNRPAGQRGAGEMAAGHAAAGAALAGAAAMLGAQAGAPGGAQGGAQPGPRPGFAGWREHAEQAVPDGRRGALPGAAMAAGPSRALHAQDSAAQMNRPGATQAGFAGWRDHAPPAGQAGQNAGPPQALSRPLTAPVGMGLAGQRPPPSSAQTPFQPMRESLRPVQGGMLPQAQAQHRMPAAPAEQGMRSPRPQMPDALPRQDMQQRQARADAQMQDRMREQAQQQNRQHEQQMQQQQMQHQQQMQQMQQAQRQQQLDRQQQIDKLQKQQQQMQAQQEAQQKARQAAEQRAGEQARRQQQAAAQQARDQARDQARMQAQQQKQQQLEASQRQRMQAQIQQQQQQQQRMAAKLRDQERNNRR